MGLEPTKTICVDRDQAVIANSACERGSAGVAFTQGFVLNEQAGGLVHAVRSSSRSFAVGKHLIERIALTLIGMDSAVVLAAVVFAVFGWCLWNLR